MHGDEREVVVTFQLDGRQKALKAAKLIVATGRTPNTEHLRLELPGVDLDERGFVKVNDELRMSAEHVMLPEMLLAPTLEARWRLLWVHKTGVLPLRTH